LRALWRDNSLSLVFLAFFVAALAGQAFAGWHAYNNEAVTHHQETITLGRYLVRLWIYSNSLVLVMGTIWLASWCAQSITGWSAYGADQLAHGEPRVGYLQYLGSASFWENTLENWQSEFLAVGSMAVLAIYLRQRGSPESKPVGAPHSATGVEG
jgi:hypothetical protein